MNCPRCRSEETIMQLHTKVLALRECLTCGNRYVDCLIQTNYPTSGTDPNIQHAIERDLRVLKAAGKTTPEEVEEVC